MPIPLGHWREAGSSLSISCPCGEAIIADDEDELIELFALHAADCALARDAAASAYVAERQ